MERSLSILLPAHNAQATLRESVDGVLELAAELTPRFELLIIDYGSSDHTIELAHELARCYPQVDAVRLSQRAALPEVVRLGLDRTCGEILCIHEGEGPVNVADLRRLWQMRDDDDLILARHEARGTPQAGWLERLLSAAPDPASAGPASGFHLLRRDAIEASDAGHSLSTSRREVRLHRSESQPAQQRRPTFISKLRRLSR